MKASFLEETALTDAEFAPWEEASVGPPPPGHRSYSLYGATLGPGRRKAVPGRFRNTSGKFLEISGSFDEWLSVDEWLSMNTSNLMNG